MKEFFGGIFVAFCAYLIINIILSVQLSLVVNDCERNGMFTHFNKVYECREVQK